MDIDPIDRIPTDSDPIDLIPMDIDPMDAIPMDIIALQPRTPHPAAMGKGSAECGTPLL